MCDYAADSTPESKTVDMQQMMDAMRQMMSSFQEDRRARAEEREAFADRIAAVEESTRRQAEFQTPTRDAAAAVTSPLLDTFGALRSAAGGFPPVARVRPAQRSLHFGPATVPAQPGGSSAVAAVPTAAAAAPIKGLPKPDKFAGADVRERASARIWVQSICNWMELSVPDRSDADQVRVFATFLSGDALRWFEQQRAQYAAQQQPLTLATVVDLFIRRMQADDALAALTAEFFNLTLWVSTDCSSDLHATEAAFDSRAMVLYPGAAFKVEEDSMLAGMYGQVIQRGDRGLWEDALRHSPRTLAYLILS
jgi:hypothetical protein